MQTTMSAPQRNLHAESDMISASMDKKIAVVIGVTDMQRAVDFYRSTLGLPLKFQTPTHSEFKTSGAALVLEKRAKVTANGPCFWLPTRNVKKDREGLQRSSIQFWEELHSAPYGWVMMPQDTEGNIFAIVQATPKKKRARPVQRKSR
jgi:predicted enzyme related to lactoylglutathione lyase